MSFLRLPLVMIVCFAAGQVVDTDPWISVAIVGLWLLDLLSYYFPRRDSSLKAPHSGMEESA